MSEDLKIVSARFDPEKWELELTTSSGDTSVLDLTKYNGFGLDSEALRRVEICDCGLTVSFPDFPAPGALLTFEPLE